MAFVPAPFAICDLCLDGMKHQAALVESVIEQRLQLFGFALIKTMTHNIIGIPLELNTLPVLFHPNIKHIVQKQVCQKWSEHASDTKGNFDRLNVRFSLWLVARHPGAGLESNDDRITGYQHLLDQ